MADSPARMADLSACPKLTVIAGPLKGATFSGEVLTIGRTPDNQIAIPDKLLSRQHCRLITTETTASVIDSGSFNGTFVNGVQVKERELNHGDLIQVGNSLLLFETANESETGDATTRVLWDDVQVSPDSLLTLHQDAALAWPTEQLHQLSLNARRAQELQAFIESGFKLHQLREPQEIQEFLIAAIRSIVPAQHGAFLRLQQDSFEFCAGFGWEENLATAALMTNNALVSRTIVQRAVRERIAILHENVPTDLALQQTKSLLLAGVQSVIAAPVATASKTFGVLYLDTHSPTARFDEWQLKFVTLLANLAAHSLQYANEFHAIAEERNRLQAAVSQQLIGQSKPMQLVHQQIAKFAPSDSTVLILGENGTGKELVAQAIHQNSTRANKPFFAINCAAFTETLIESELFGYEKAAFTGANSLKKGQLESADGGTVFLDEIGDMKLELQAKLLRVLEMRELVRVGGTRPVKLDLRILAATNHDLTAAIQAGTFRQDLYHRLCIFPITLPPLRERRDDIERLARNFMQTYGAKASKFMLELDAATLQCLTDYDWPGNVRELRNAIEYAVTLNSTGTLLPEDLPAHIAQAEPQRTGHATSTNESPTAPLPPLTDTSLNYREAVKNARKQIIRQAFAQSNNNHQAAAELLGLHPNNLHRELRLLNLREQLK